MTTLRCVCVYASLNCLQERAGAQVTFRGEFPPTLPDREKKCTRQFLNAVAFKPSTYFPILNDKSVALDWSVISGEELLLVLF